MGQLYSKAYPNTITNEPSQSTPPQQLSHQVPVHIMKPVDEHPNEDDIDDEDDDVSTSSPRWHDDDDDAKREVTVIVPAKKVDIPQEINPEFMINLTLLEFLRKNGHSIDNIMKKIFGILNHHKKHNYYRLAEIMEREMGVHQDFDVMENAIKFVREERRALSLPETSNHVVNLSRKNFKMQMESFIGIMAAVASGSANLGSVLVDILHTFKEINLYDEDIQSQLHTKRSVAIIDVRCYGDNTGTVIFEVGRVDVKIMVKKRVLGMFGLNDVKVRLKAFYAEGTAGLRELIPNDAERREVIQLITQARPPTFQHHIDGFLKK